MIFIKGVLIDNDEIKAAYDWSYIDSNYIRQIGTEILYRNGDKTYHTEIKVSDIAEALRNKI